MSNSGEYKHCPPLVTLEQVDRITSFCSQSGDANRKTERAFNMFEALSSFEERSRRN